MQSLTKQKLKINLKEATVTEINHHPHYLYSLNQLKIKFHCIAKNECGILFEIFQTNVIITETKHLVKNINF